MMAFSRRIPWQVKAPIPQARLGACAVATDDMLYSIGGLDARGRAVPTVDLYSNRLNRWYEGPRLPAGRYCAAAALYKRHLWVLGGFTSADRIPTTTVFIWKHGTGQWERGPDLPEARGAHSVGVHQDQLYIAGGQTIHGPSSDFIRYGSSLLEWEQPVGVTEWDHVDPFPEAAEGSGGGFCTTQFVLCGGRGTDRASATTNVYEKEAGWRRGKDPPVPRWGAVAAVLGPWLVLAGGQNETGLLDRVDAFCPGTNRWIALPKLPYAVHGASGGIMRSVLYIIGGGRSSGLSFSQTVVALNLQKTELADTEQFEPATQTVPEYTVGRSAGRRTMP